MVSFFHFTTYCYFSKIMALDLSQLLPPTTFEYYILTNDREVLFFFFSFRFLEEEEIY